MVDSLKRRDVQIDAKLRSHGPVMSTPVPPPWVTPAYPVRSHKIPILPDSVNDVAYRPPVKV